MIVEVYPLKRLPRTMSHFDYLVADGQTLARGELVQIPYRNKILWGVVRRVKDKPPRGIELKSTIEGTAPCALREEELSFFEWMATDLAQSVSSVLYAAIPRPPKRASKRSDEPLAWKPLTLPSVEVTHALRLVSALEERAKAFVQVPDIRRSMAVIVGYLQKHPEQKVLLLAPTVRDVELVRKALTGMSPIILTGEESNNVRFERWHRFRSMSAGVLLGTRTAALAVDASVTAVFVLRSGERNYKSSERNPRFDARALAWQMHEQFATSLYYFDVVPNPQTVHGFAPTEQLSWGAAAESLLIDINQQRFAGPSKSITHTVAESISQALALGQRTLCVFNKKGLARALRCEDCGSVARCAACGTVLVARENTLECSHCRSRELISQRCQDCQGARLKGFAPGNIEVAREMAVLFPEHTVSVIDKEHPEDLGADILIVTAYWYEALYNPFKKARFGLVVQLDADTPLFGSSPLAIDNLSRSLWHWSSVAYACRAPFLVQSASTKLIEKILQEPFVAAQEELMAREQYGLPPAVRWARVSYRDEEPKRAQFAIEQLTDQMTAVGARAQAVEQIVYKTSVVEVGLPPETFEKLLSIFTGLRDRYIIDTDIYGC